MLLAATAMMLSVGSYAQTVGLSTPGLLAKLTSQDKPVRSRRQRSWLPQKTASIAFLE